MMTVTPRLNNSNAPRADKESKLISLSDAVDAAGEPNGKCWACGASTDLDGEACPEALFCTDCDSELEDLADEIG